MFEHDIIRRGTLARVRLRGELDLATTSDLDAPVRALLADCPHVIIELDELDFCDSSGVRELLDLRAHARGLDATLTVDGATPALRRLLGLMDAERVLCG